jgi:hypothetical protein
MKKAAVILGAGASFAVSNDSRVLSREADSFHPPLARSLFAPTFWGIRQRYRGAVVIGSELGSPEIMDAGAFDLEARLTGIARHPDPRNRRHFRDIPPYLRDLLLACSAHHQDSPANYINLVRYLLEDQTHEVLFVLLNYDTLLESALGLYDPDCRIQTLQDYVAQERQALVIKVHGSTNWGLPLRAPWLKSTEQDLSRVLDALDPLDADLRLRDSLVLNDDSTRCPDWRLGETLLYPLLTAPLRGKTFVCPEDHSEALRAFLADCHQFLVIGTSGLDEDLLEVLSECITGSAHHVTYVGRGPTIIEVQSRFEQSVNAFKQAGRRAKFQATTFDCGFRDWTTKENVKAFLEVDN